MHQEGTQQAIAQVPEIACPYALDAPSIGQLPKDRVYQVAHPAQHLALGGFGFGGRGVAKQANKITPLRRSSCWMRDTQ